MPDARVCVCVCAWVRARVAGFDAVPALYIRLRMAGHEVTAFIDTGAGLSLVSYDFADRLGLIPLVDRSTSIEIQGAHACARAHVHAAR